MAGKAKNLAGQRFGRLLVFLAATSRRKPSGQAAGARWHVECDCGARRVVDASALLSGATKSCGCLHREIVAEIGRKSGPRLRGRFKPGAAFRQLRANYRADARNRGRTFLLTDDQFSVLTQGSCFYCGVAPSRDFSVVSGDHYLCHGIDRVDSTGNYEIDNCVSCCESCNRLKGLKSLTEFVASVRAIAVFHALV